MHGHDLGTASALRLMHIQLLHIQRCTGSKIASFDGHRLALDERT